MAKIKVANPVVELDGDEMTRIIWGFIEDRLTLPYLDVGLKHYDLGIGCRGRTDARVTVGAAYAIEQYGVGVKCATTMPGHAVLPGQARRAPEGGDGACRGGGLRRRRKHGQHAHG